MQDFLGITATTELTTPKQLPSTDISTTNMKQNPKNSRTTMTTPSTPSTSQFYTVSTVSKDEPTPNHTLSSSLAGAGYTDTQRTGQTSSMQAK